jgi:uncharacterized protein (TIGR02145 family)
MKQLPLKMYKMKKLLLFSVFINLISPSYNQTVTDIDGNVYNTVTIWTQVWMKENLKTTKYNDGTSIAAFPIYDTTPSYSWYDYDPVNLNTYGALYNQYTVISGKLCPTGWHIPSDNEWTTLTDYLGGDSVAGGKLKEIDTVHWVSPNTGATNESGFTALPGGYRFTNKFCFDMGSHGYWWSATVDSSSGNLFCRSMSSNSSNVQRPLPHQNYIWYSVRCLEGNNASITISKNAYEVILYPNPATLKLYLKNSIYVNGIIMIFDIQGKQILRKKIDSDPIDISNIENGIYTVKLVYSDNIMITKFVKK